MLTKIFILILQHALNIRLPWQTWEKCHALKKYISIHLERFIHFVKEVIKKYYLCKMIVVSLFLLLFSSFTCKVRAELEDNQRERCIWRKEVYGSTCSSSSFLALIKETEKKTLYQLKRRHFKILLWWYKLPQNY